MTTKKNPKPFLKWAGGKSQLLKDIEEHLPKEVTNSKSDDYKGVIDSYIEPFVGGGAVFFYLISHYDIKKAYLSDINKELILTYHVIKNNPNKLIEKLNYFSTQYKNHNDCKENMKKYFYKIRKNFNNKLSDFNFDYSENKLKNKHIERAAQMIFLNKTCFNGLFRVNLKGEFNVPCAYSKNPLICDEDNIKNVSKALKNVTIVSGDYKECVNVIEDNSFIYLDPPYKPINGTSTFNGYSGIFDDKNQEELANFYKKLDKKGVKVLLSNSNPKCGQSNEYYFDSLYNDFKIDLVDAKRFINSKGHKRGPVQEILVSNYKY